jgi:tol-pal system protein YbgF
LESRERSEGPPPVAPGAAASLRDSSAPSHQTANETFSAAATAFAAQQYESAITTLRAFLAQYPSDSRAPDARFLLADAYRAQNRYAEASAEFAAFLRLYPEHRRAPAALYRQGEVRLHLGDKAGCDILRDALSRHADAPEAQSAREMLSTRCP